jgi:hypothetical protein
MTTRHHASGKFLPRGLDRRTIDRHAMEDRSWQILKTFPRSDDGRSGSGPDDEVIL